MTSTFTHPPGLWNGPAHFWRQALAVRQVSARKRPAPWGHLLTDLFNEDWGRRYGPPVRLGKHATRPKTRVLAAGDDTCRLFPHLHLPRPGYRTGPQATPLRQIVLQDYCRATAGRLTCTTAKPCT